MLDGLEAGVDKDGAGADVDEDVAAVAEEENDEDEGGQDDEPGGGGVLGHPDIGGGAEAVTARDVVRTMWD
eukprot:8878766-Pyramimonas_sp.AAC.1